MATTFEYNGIDLGLVRTVKIDQRAEYDQSNTDVVNITNRFNIRSVLSPGISGTGELGPEGGPAGRMAEIRHMLLQPRRPFRYAASDDQGEVDLLAVEASLPGGYAIDAANGPKPIACEVIQVSEETWIIDFIIDVAVQDCNASQIYASNRFETTHDIDHKGYSVITTLGKVIVRSDMRKSPDALRWVVTPPLPKGFRRKSMYQLHEDGLSMMYRIVDTEMYLAPPETAMEAKGRFTITAVPPGAIMFCQCDIRLEGRKGQPKRQLMETAILIALRRLEAGGAMRDPIKGKPWVEGGTVSEELYENVVEVSLKGRIQSGPLLHKEGPLFDLYYGFWQGFMPNPFALGIGAGIPAAAAKAWDGDLFSGNIGTAVAKAVKAAKDAAARAAGTNQKAAGDKQSPSKIDPPRDKGDKPAVPAQKAPAAPFATIDGLIERFGTDVEGSHQDGTVNPGLRGNVEFLEFLAASFRDPCVADAFFRAVPLKSADGAVQPVANNMGVGPGMVELCNRWKENDDALNYLVSSANRRTGGANATPDPSLDWWVQRLGRLKNQHVVDGSLTMTVEKALPDDYKPAPPLDQYPGWYEAWYCEVEHDFESNTRVLASTVEGTPAVRVQWANPLRTVRIRWGVTKAMWPPELPMILGDPNTVVVKHRMALPTVEIGADGKTPIFHTSGETEYQLLNERNAFAAYPMPPWLQLPMSAMPGPIPRASVVVTSGDDGAAQASVMRSAGIGSNTKMTSGGRSTLSTPTVPGSGA